MPAQGRPNKPHFLRVAGRGTLSFEEGLGWEAMRGLLQRGHKVSSNLGSHGGYQAIRYDPEQGVYYGASESRKDGQAAGW
jgi:gamma-glutamyltranspeptidase / glutathione hydrolase